MGWLESGSTVPNNIPMYIIDWPSIMIIHAGIGAMAAVLDIVQAVLTSLPSSGED